MSDYKTNLNRNYRKRRLEPIGQDRLSKRVTLSEDIYLKKKNGKRFRDFNDPEKLSNSSHFMGVAGKRFPKHKIDKFKGWQPSSSEATNKTYANKRPNHYKRRVEDNINSYKHRRSVDSNVAEVTLSNCKEVTSEYIEKSDSPDYTVVSDAKNSELSCQKTYKEECEDSERWNNLFNGCCIKYLKTSECAPPCTLSHEVGDLLIGGKYNDSDYGSDEDGVQMSLKTLQEFLSEAPSPPLSLIEKACDTFASFKAADAIISISKIFISHYTLSDSVYMRSVFKILIFPLTQILGSQDSAVTAVLNYLCKECIPKNSQQEMLDKVVKTIEDTVRIDNKLNVFSTLVAVENYIFPQALLEDLFCGIMQQTQKWIRKNYVPFKTIALLVLRDSQEEHLFNIWKKSPHFVKKLTYYLKTKNSMLTRILRRKLVWFESLLNTGGHYKSRVALCAQPTRKVADPHRTKSLTNKHSNANTMSTERRNISNANNRSSGFREMISVNIPNVSTVECVKVSTAVSRDCQRQPVDMIFHQQSSPVFKQQHLIRSSGGNASGNTGKILSRNECSSVPRPCNFNIIEELQNKNKYEQRVESQCQNMSAVNSRCQNMSFVNKTPPQIGRIDNLKSCSVNMFTKPEVYENTGRQDSQNFTSSQYQQTSTFFPQKAPRMSLSESLALANRDSKTDLTSKSNYRMGVPIMKNSVDMYHNTLGENQSERDSVRFDKNSTFHAKQKCITLPASGRSQSSISSEHSVNSNSTLPLLPTFADLEKDAFSLNQYLQADAYQSVLNILDKWQNSQYSSNMTKHVFCTLANMYISEKEKSYSLFEGLLSAATISATGSLAVKASLSSVSLSLLLHMVTRGNWLYAYEIFKLIMKHELLYTYCEVYKNEEYSEARRVMTFVEVCMQNMDFKQAVFLLVDHNMLAVDRECWQVQSTPDDMILRNDLIKALIDKMGNDDLSLQYSLLIDLLAAQRDVTEPINLVKSYESLLRKLLDQTDELRALQLFKEVYSCQEVPVVSEKNLCRALVITCVRNNEMDLARKLVKRGSFIGAYPRNNSMFVVMINSSFSEAEMRILIEEALNTIGKKLTSHGEIDSDLHFAIIEGEHQYKNNLPKQLMDISCSIADARRRLISVLQAEFDLCLCVNNQDFNSPYVVVQKSELAHYFSHHLQNERS